MEAREIAIRHSVRRHAIGGVVLLVVLLGAIGGWAATTDFSGAVIAQGQLVVETNPKKVQHPTGGVVGELKVREGDRVKAGDIVLKLDDTQLKANLAIATKSIDEMMARQARSQAERDDDAAIMFPSELIRRRGERDVAQIVDGEVKLFESRRSTRDAKKTQLKSRLFQLEEEVKGLNSQLTAKDREIVWVKRELEGVRKLWEQNLVQITRLTQLEREAAKIEGDQGALIAQIAQARGRIAELTIQVLQVDEDIRTEAGKELADLRTRLAELFEKRVSAEDQLVRTELRAPRDGVVHQLDVHTVGGVISPGQQTMVIVPDAETLKVEAKVQPQDIDQLSIGQPAVLRFATFNQRTTPELRGVLTLVSADVTQDQRTGLAHYTVRLEIPAEEVARLETATQKLIPGMPVDVFVQTTPRTVLSYLMRPLFEQIARAFRGR
jgi:HlyD family secretion protein